MNYCLIADFFQEDLCRGAELNISALIELLRRDHKITTRRSHTVTPQFIKDNDYVWIVSNRMNLSQEAKEALEGKVYFVHENDAGWLSTKDFGLYEDFIPPQEHIVNRNFYEKATKVVMQSKIHELAINRALDLKNTVCSNGNTWSKIDLDYLRSLCDTPKTEEYAVIYHSHPSKGTAEAIEFCKENDFNYKIIPELPRQQFLKELSKFKFLVFLPGIFESYSRIAAEFRALNGTIITNNKLSFKYEQHSDLSGEGLIDFFEQNNYYIKNIFR